MRVTIKEGKVCQCYGGSGTCEVLFWGTSTLNLNSYHHLLNILPDSICFASTEQGAYVACFQTHSDNALRDNALSCSSVLTNNVKWQSFQTAARPENNKCLIHAVFRQAIKGEKMVDAFPFLLLFPPRPFECGRVRHTVQALAFAFMCCRKIRMKNLVVPTACTNFQAAKWGA